MQKMRFIFICLFVFAYWSASTQNTIGFSYTNFNASNGLPSSQVQGLFQDSHGYIWVLTDRGVARYDGYEFKIYSSENGLYSPSILLINEDAHGNIWVMTNEGKYYHLDHDFFKEYKGNKRIAALLKDKLPGPFFFDDDNVMWATTFSGTQLFKCVEDSVEEYQPEWPSNQAKPTYFLKQVNDRLLNLRVGEVKEVNEIQTAPDLTYLLNVAGECKLACSVQVESNKWVVSGPGGYVVFSDKGEIVALFEPSPYVFGSMDRDRSGNLWTTDSHGAHLIHDYSNPRNRTTYFEGRFITTVIQDQQGNYWFGDRDNGVYLVPSLNISVIRSRENASKKQKITSLKEWNGQIYAGDASGQVHVLKGKDLIPMMVSELESEVSVDFCVLPNGDLLTGSKPSIYSVQSKRFSQPITDKVMRGATLLKDNTVAIATPTGILMRSPQGDVISVSEGRFKERTNKIYEGGDSDRWVGTNSGLFQWYNDSIYSVAILNELKPRVFDICEWKDYLLLATRNLGLIVFHTESGSYFVLNHANGLLSSITDAVCVDAKDRIWLGQQGGVQRITYDSVLMKFHFHTLNVSKGLSSNEINDLLILNDTVYAATNDGISIWPARLIDAAPESNVLIHTFRTGEEELALVYYPELTYDRNNISISFTALNFRTGVNTQYRYRLNGYNTEWVVTDARTIFYWQLPPSSYTFEVQAMNEDGIWSESSILSFKVLPHFSQTIWFKVLSAISIIALVLFFSFLYHRRKREELNVRTKMTELKQQALNANMNPHFIFNALNSIQHLINSGKSVEANEYLSSFSALVRKNLESIRYAMVSLEDELERLDLYIKLEQLRFGDRVRYVVDIDEKVHPYDLEIPPMLLQPYVENALLHGILPEERQGTILLSIRIFTTKYIISIKDDGVGIEHSRLNKRSDHESMALKMNEERMSLIRSAEGADFGVVISDLSVKGEKGTEVIITLPI